MSRKARATQLALLDGVGVSPLPPPGAVQPQALPALPAEPLQRHRASPAALLEPADGLQLTQLGTTLPTNSWGLSPWKGSYKNKCTVAQPGTTASASITL